MCDTYDLPLTSDIILANRYFAKLSLSTRQLLKNHKNGCEGSRCTPRTICSEGNNWVLCSWLEILLQQCLVPLLNVGRGCPVAKEGAVYVGMKSFLARERREARQSPRAMTW